MDNQQPVAIRQGGAELIEQLAPLWQALHEHHQAIVPPYHDAERSWPRR